MHSSQFVYHVSDINNFTSRKFYFICFCCCCILKSSYLHQVVKESRIERFGQGVSCVGGLLLV